MGVSHLHERKFKKDFQDIMNPLDTCDCNFDNVWNLFLQCPNFFAEINTLLNKITNINSNTLNKAEATITKTLLFDNSNYFDEVKLKILNASINFVLTTRRFNESLLNS